MYKTNFEDIYRIAVGVRVRQPGGARSWGLARMGLGHDIGLSLARLLKDKKVAHRGVAEPNQPPAAHAILAVLKAGETV